MKFYVICYYINCYCKPSRVFVVDINYLDLLSTNHNLLRTHDIMMLGGINDKLLKNNLNFTREMEIMKWVYQTIPIITRLTYKIQKEVELERVYMRPERNSNRFEISNHFEKSFHLHSNFTAANLEISNRFQKLFHLHGDFTTATFQTTVRFSCTCANDSL